MQQIVSYSCQWPCLVAIVIVVAAMQFHGSAAQARERDHPLSGEQLELQDHEEGHRRLRQMARHYEVVPVDTRRHHNIIVGTRERFRRSRRSTTGAGILKHPLSTTFVVHAFGKRLTLELRLNEGLLSDKFHVRVENDVRRVDEPTLQQPTSRQPVEHCYYHGKVVGLGEKLDAESYAAISTCRGVSGVFGVHTGRPGTEDMADLETYYIEPLASRPGANGSHMHGVYRSIDAVESQHSKEEDMAVRQCTSADRLDDLLDPGAEDSRVRGMEQARHRRSATAPAGNTSSNTTNPTRPHMYIETMLLLDETMAAWIAQSPSDRHDYPLRVMNLADINLRPLNMATSIVSLSTITVGAANISRAAQPGATYIDVLLKFNDYIRALPSGFQDYDTMHLLTRTPLKTGEVGTAVIDSMCNASNSASFTQVQSTDIVQTALIVTHELGHVLGFTHNSYEDGSSCHCPAPLYQGGCVMDPSAAVGVSAITTPWNNCSTSKLQQGYEEGSLNCLLNKPITTRPAPVCGNGYVEGDEQCDCGALDDCTDPCCDYSRCRFVSGAVCSRGPCCNQCQFRNTSHVCRAAVTGGCDVEERCTGQANTCPQDIHVQSGKPCNTNSTGDPSHCDRGLCRNRDNQCKKMWIDIGNPELANVTNSSGSACDGICPNTFNPVRTNCTANPCGYISCTYVQNLTTHLASYRGKSADGKCTVFGGISGSGFQFVDDFTACGQDSVCMNRSCVSLASLNIMGCPVLNGAECSGRGVCTNLNTCYCDQGWTGKDCSAVDTGTALNVTACPVSNGTECSGNGVCTILKTCNCDPGWSGKDCSASDVPRAGDTSSGAARPATTMQLSTLLLGSLLSCIITKYHSM